MPPASPVMLAMMASITTGEKGLVSLSPVMSNTLPARPDMNLANSVVSRLCLSSVSNPFRLPSISLSK